MKRYNLTQWTVWTWLTLIIISGLWTESGKAQQGQARMYDSQTAAKYVGMVDDTLTNNERKYFYIAWPTALSKARIDTTFSGITWERHYVDARSDRAGFLTIILDSLVGVTDSLKTWIIPIQPMIGTDGKDTTAVIPINWRGWPDFTSKTPIISTDSSKSLYNWTDGKAFGFNLSGLPKAIGCAIGFQIIDYDSTALSRLRITLTY